MLLKLADFLKGKVIVELNSPQYEQILNVLHRCGAACRKIKMINEQIIEVTIFEKDAAILKEVCKRYGVGCKIMCIYSVRNTIKKYKRRWGILFGFIGVTVLVTISGSFIWDVQVAGCEEKTTEQEVMRQFQALGLGVGMSRKGLDISDIENRFLLQNDDVFWVSVNIKFTTVYIELRERNGKNIEVYDLTSPCDIYAARDGQIISMIITSGTPLIKIGDSVCAGEKLVSREYVDRYGKSIIVHSIASIKAKTRRVIQSELPLTNIKHTPSGKTKSFYTLNLFNFKLPLYFKEKISYNNYDRTEGRTVLKIGSFAFPISLSRITYSEVEVSKESVQYEQAKLAVLADLEKQEKEQLFKAEILDKTIKEKTVGDRLVLTAEYQCVEDIAYTVGD